MKKIYCFFAPFFGRTDKTVVFRVNTKNFWKHRIIRQKEPSCQHIAFGRTVCTYNFRRRHRDSSRQAEPVSQKQIRQREYDIEFGSLLFKPSVSRFPKPQLFFDDTKYVLHLRTDRRFCVFRFLGRVLAAFTQFL